MIAMVMLKVKFVFWIMCLRTPFTSGKEFGVNLSNGIKDLASESDFRSLKLQWRYDSDSEPIGFFITLCEILPWASAKRNCFERHLLLGKRATLSGHDSMASLERGRYEAVLYDLRMSTNYTVNVEPMLSKTLQLPRKRKQGGRARLLEPEQIVVTTKGFTAQATNCLPDSSDIVVHTGPYFGGKITVEGSTDERCSVYGNRSSSKDTYILRMEHQLCGSKTMNNSRTDTMVLVYESSSVVTHNTRMFLVQCSFIPDTFTIKATFSVPEEMDKKDNYNYEQLERALNNMDSNDVFTYDQYKQNHVKDSRMLAEQKSIMHESAEGYESQVLGLLIVVIVLVIVIVIVIGLSLFWYISSHRRRRNTDVETVSTSGSSFMTFQGDGESLMRCNALTNDANPMPRNMNPFYGAQVALVSLKPVKEQY